MSFSGGAARAALFMLRLILIAPKRPVLLAGRFCVMGE